MPHSTGLSSFSSYEYLLSVSVKALEQYVTGLHRLARGSYCFKVAAVQPGPASDEDLIESIKQDKARNKLVFTRIKNKLLHLLDEEDYPSRWEVKEVCQRHLKLVNEHCQLKTLSFECSVNY